MDDRGRRPNRRRNDTLINYVMMGLVALLIVFLIFYIVRAVANLGGDRSIKPDTAQETDLESQRETDRETDRESSRETESESDRETESERETDRETERETAQETERETQRETAEETVRETEAEAEEDYVMPTPDTSRRANDPNAAIYTADQIRNLPQSVIVDMVIRGDLGYGRERLDILNAAGLDYDQIHNAVNQKLQQ